MSAISHRFDFIPITQCLQSPAVQKIVILGQQQGKKSRDPQRDEFIGSVGQLGQLIMLLSGGARKERGEAARRRRREGRQREGAEERCGWGLEGEGVGNNAHK